MNPPADEHSRGYAERDTAADRIVSLDPDPSAGSEDDRPFNLSMYLDFLHGTD